MLNEVRLSVSSGNLSDGFHAGSASRTPLWPGADVCPVLGLGLPPHVSPVVEPHSASLVFLYGGACDRA